MGHIRARHGLPFLKMETDYSRGDVEQIRTRVEAMLESITPKRTKVAVYNAGCSVSLIKPVLAAR